MARVRSEIERAQRDLSRERELIDDYLSNEDREQALQYLETDYDCTLLTLRRELLRLEIQLQTSIRSAERIYRRIAGVPWAYRVSRRRLRSWIQQAADSCTLRILAVSPGHSLLLGLLEPVSGLHMHLTPESVAEGALGRLPKAGPDFDVCLVELIDLEAPRARELLDAVAGRLKNPGTILVHWHDQGSVPLRSVHNQIVQFALDRGCRVNAYYAGSWASANAVRTFQQARKTPAWRRMVPLAWFAALAVSAELRERTRNTQVMTIPKHCSSAIFQIEMQSQEVLDSIAAQIDSKPQKATLIKALPRARKAHPAGRPSNREPTGVVGFSEEHAGSKQ